MTECKAGFVLADVEWSGYKTFLEDDFYFFKIYLLIIHIFLVTTLDLFPTYVTFL